MKDTLRLKILWTWIKIRANSFIKTLVNNMKRKPTKVPWTLSLTKKNVTPHFKEHCTKIDISLVVIRFFFSQTNVVFKSNPLFIDILDSFCPSLFTFSPFDFYFYSTDFVIFYQFQSDCSDRVCPYKKVHNFLGSYSGTRFFL